MQAIVYLSTWVRSPPMLDCFIGGCMVSISNINNGIKELSMYCQNCNINQMFIFDGYLKVRESWYTCIFIWINTILNHIDIQTMFLYIKILVWNKYPNCIESKTISLVYKLWIPRFGYPKDFKDDTYWY